MGEPLLRGFLIAGLLLFVGAILHLGAPVIVPVVEALVVWFVLNAMASGLRQIPGVGARLPRWLALLVSAAIVLALALVLVRSTVTTIASIGPGAQDLQRAFDPTIARLADLLGFDADVVINRTLDRLGIESMVRSLVAGMIGLVSHVGIVAIYVGFLLVDQQFFEAKLNALVRDPERRARTRAIFARISRSIQTYLWIMTLVSGLTASLSWLILVAVGVDNAFFLAATIFVLNFIPTIGSILGTVVPTVFALMQMQGLAPALVVLAGIGLVQFVVGNILLPRLAGGSLNISLFVTILSLFVFGALWGVTGMFVAMPLTAILIIVCGHFETTRPIAVLLSRTGEVEVERA
jgi:AI-2 transport protein TqsA